MTLDHTTRHDMTLGHMTRTKVTRLDIRTHDMTGIRGAGDPGLGGAHAQRGGGGRGGVRELRRVRGGGRHRGLGGALGVQNQPGGDIPLHLRGGCYFYRVMY